ncbi:hypothetical protein PCANC_04104, partial [Puccinia coronata f. sp. avenae]
GQAVKLCNKQHTKGAPRWFRPFEISKSTAIAFGLWRCVSLVVNDMWALPLAIAQREKRADKKVARDLLKKTRAVARAVKAIPGPPPEGAGGPVAVSAGGRVAKSARAKRPTVVLPAGGSAVAPADAPAVPVAGHALVQRLCLCLWPESGSKAAPG